GRRGGAAGVATGRIPDLSLLDRSGAAHSASQVSAKSAPSANPAAGIAPARIIVLSTLFTPRKMYSPRPPAPIAAAIVAVPTPTTVATRTPARIAVRANGSST